MRSSSSNLPDARQISFFNSCFWWSSKKRKGWLHNLRSCISTLFSPDTLSCPPSATLQSPCSCICRYINRCMGERSHLITYSALSGSSASTSDFSRRRRKGRSTWCSRLITSSDSSSLISRSSTVEPPVFSASGAENQVSKESEDANILGSRKLSRAHSSCSEFCSGVPVSNIRCRDSYCSKVAESLEVAFFMRWPSSMMMYSYLNFLRRCLSFMTSS
mmetsp:Transcript_23962/g.39639  ORF Transcript_23962/g.39639 Transcript_23962/m.39639 type:complete len:218 (-) Transcript_23962:609-1262(-)